MKLIVGAILSRSQEELKSSENLFEENVCRFSKDLEKKIFFLKSSKDLPTKIYEDLSKNDISRSSYVKIFVRSHSSEDLKKA